MEQVQSPAAIPLLPKPVPRGPSVLFAHQALVAFDVTDLFSDYLITLGFYPEETFMHDQEGFKTYLNMMSNIFT